MSIGVNQATAHDWMIVVHSLSAWGSMFPYTWCLYASWVSRPRNHRQSLAPHGFSRPWRNLCLVSWQMEETQTNFDALTYSHLGEERYKWGSQRVWGMIGYTLFGVAVGFVMDAVERKTRYINCAYASPFSTTFWQHCLSTFTRHPTMWGVPNPFSNCFSFWKAWKSSHYIFWFLSLVYSQV